MIKINKLFYIFKYSKIALRMCKYVPFLCQKCIFCRTSELKSLFFRICKCHISSTLCHFTKTPNRLTISKISFTKVQKRPLLAHIRFDYQTSNTNFAIDLKLKPYCRYGKPT